MNTRYTFSIVASIMLAGTVFAQTEWTGPMMTMTKASNADWTLEENQDRITENVWITRQDNNLIYNIAVDVNPGDALVNDISDTEWAVGSIADGVDNLAFVEFLDAAVDSDACPPCALNIPMVLHLISDDIFIDFTLTSWNGETVAPPGVAQGGFGSPGGQFSYTRSTDQNVSVDEFATTDAIKLQINAGANTIVLAGLERKVNYNVYSLTGAQVLSGSVEAQEELSIATLESGIYILQVEAGTAIKFTKP